MAADRRPRVLAPLGRDEEFYAPTRVELEKAGAELVLRPYRTAEELLPLAKDVDALYQSSVTFNRELLSQLPNLKVICARGIGFDNFDVDAATELGIVVVNLPRVFHREVAAHTMALLLTMIRQIVPLNAAMHARANNPSQPLHTAGSRPRQHIFGQTLGLIAFGNIARVVATMARGFEMRILAYDPFVKQEVADQYGVKLVSLEELLRESDFVSMHTPLMKNTFHLMGEEQFRQMKPTAYIVNTSRGRTIDEVALIKALREGWIAGAGLDVTETEPPDVDNPLLTMGNVILTPHIASASDLEHVERARWMGIEVGRVLNGQWPIHGLVNKGVKPRIPIS
ncbi:MAG TPA: phosphoglycerate dehydrogenase [Chloroflexota bacterium]|nr:phosphoglycerate dehydrogenase [Chloroflexota bacterium]